MANLNQQTGQITANGQTILQTNADTVRTFVFDVSGTFVATAQVQTSIDGTNWRNVTSSTAVLNLSTGAFVSSGNITAAGLYAIDVSAVSLVRIISTAYTSGTANFVSIVTVNGNMQPSAASVAVTGTATVSGTVTANQGTLLTGTTYNLVTAATTNAASVKSTAGNLFELTISNPTATAAYVKLYNKASAPTVGTDVPVLTIPVPATAAGVGTVTLNLGILGKRFATGIAIAVTGAAVATDTTATVAGIQINGTYI